MTDDLRPAPFPDSLSVLLVLGAALFAAGCNSGSTGGAKSGTTPAANAEKEAREHCADLIRSVWGTFQLRDMGVSTDLRAGVSLLNQWRQACGGDAKLQAVAAPDAARNALSAELMNLINEERFLPRDGEHLRDCVLFKRVNTYAIGRAESELGRVVNLFQHAVRAVTLVPEKADALPLTPYEIYLFGKGTAADRAWIFSAMLRQLKIDAVLIIPKAAIDEKKEGDEQNPPREQPFLVGVLLGDDAFLFDPRLGLPLPALGAKPQMAGSPQVATLAQALTEPGVLKQFDLDAEHPYGITGADLKTSRIALGGDTAFWSERMRRLQPELTGERALVVSDSLADTAAGPGLWSRVAAAGKKHWTPESLTLWKHPETQLAARSNLTAAQSQTLERLTLPWKAPVRIEVNPQNGQIAIGKPEGEQLKMRLAQINGDFEEAIIGYTRVRLQSKPLLGLPLDEPLKLMHAGAVDDASFWMGVCQFEQGNHRLAADTFQKYLKAQPSGSWIGACRYHLALCLLAQGDRDAAARTLDEIPDDDPQSTGSRLLARQWRAVSAKKP